MRRVKNLLAVLVALCPAVATAWPSPAAPAAQTPHPAVVRVIAAEPNGASLGTGALVAVDEAHGLVVTNWHVVRDATGPITVVFPDGFRSGALLLKTDRDWDLAALAIQRPQAQPLPLATEPPRPGEPLSIAGYGPEGAYRAVAGRCVKYHTPGRKPPARDPGSRRRGTTGVIPADRFATAAARLPASCLGPAGNMWSGGYTMGSYCGRVRLFLAAAYVDFQRLPGNTTMVAQAPAPQPPSNDGDRHPATSGGELFGRGRRVLRGRSCLKLQSFRRKAVAAVPHCGRATDRPIRGTAGLGRQNRRQSAQFASLRSAAVKQPGCPSFAGHREFRRPSRFPAGSIRSRPFWR